MTILTQEAYIAVAPSTESSSPRAYFACLSSYNNGRLHGAWIDCDQDADDIRADINAMLANSPEPDAEEYAIHDFENWMGIQLSETEDIEGLAELAQNLEEHGKPFAVYREYIGALYATVSEFQDTYQGVYASEEDFVEEMWEQDGRLKQLEKMGVNASYINWEAIARDWFIDSYFSVNIGYQQVYVFSRV